MILRAAGSVLTIDNSPEAPLRDMIGQEKNDGLAIGAIALSEPNTQRHLNVYDEEERHVDLFGRHQRRTFPCCVGLHARCAERAGGWRRLRRGYARGDFWRTLIVSTPNSDPKVAMYKLFLRGWRNIALNNHADIDLPAFGDEGGASR